MFTFVLSNDACFFSFFCSFTNNLFLPLTLNNALRSNVPSNYGMCVVNRILNEAVQRNWFRVETHLIGTFRLAD